MDDIDGLVPCSNSSPPRQKLCTKSKSNSHIKSLNTMRYINCGMIAGSIDFNKVLKYSRLFDLKEYLTDKSFLGGTCVMKSLASSVVTIESPTNGSKT